MGLDVVTITKSVIIKGSVCDENQVYICISSPSIKFGALWNLTQMIQIQDKKNCFKMIFNSDFIGLILGSTQTTLFFPDLLAPKCKKV